MKTSWIYLKNRRLGYRLTLIPKTFRDMIEGGEGNGFLEIGEIIHESSIPKLNYQINVKSNKGDDLSFKISEFYGKEVKDVKEQLFESHLLGKLCYKSKVEAIFVY